MLGGVANAAPPAGTLGTLTFDPTTGSNTQIITATTSRGCDTPDGVTAAARMDVTGPVGAADPTFPPTNPYPITSAQSNTVSTTDPFPIAEGNHLQQAADTRGKPIQAGEYDFTVTCVDADTLQKYGTFTGAIYFTDPTHYQTTDPNATPTATPVVTATPTATPVVTATPTATPVVTATPTATPTPSPAPKVTKTTLSIPLQIKVDGLGVLVIGDANVTTQGQGTPQGTVQFMDRNGAPIGGPVQVTGGHALLIAFRPARSTVTAVFSPALGTPFTSSRSNTVTIRS
jgi:hypothetical protein